MDEQEFVPQVEKALEESIETLYSTFASYRLEPHIDACPCCVYDKDKGKLHSKSLKELTSVDLTKYAFKAMTTWGDVSDFKHFLPRLFELQAFRGDELGNPEDLFGKLNYADWQTWSKHEQEPITIYFHSLWQYILISTEPTPTYTEVHDYLCGIAQAVDNLSFYLLAWQASNTFNAVSNLIVFIQENINTLILEMALSNPYWKERDYQMRQVVDWLLNPLSHKTWLQSEVVQANSALTDELIEVFSQLPKPKEA